jgi:hypothetical protein
VPPGAADDAVATSEDTATTMEVLGNDTGAILIPALFLSLAGLSTARPPLIRPPAR